jgi:hypothetical protein
MTLSTRNIFFRGGIIIAALALILVASGGYFAYPAFPGTAASAAIRSGGIIQKLVSGITKSSSYIPLWTMLGAAAYSLISIILIYHFFEKTQSPEILFIGFFVISLTFEFARLIIPLKAVFPLPAFFSIAASRALFFGRYFGLFSLFASGVYAAGMDAQKQQSFLLMLILAAMVIAINVPMDTFVWDSTFMVWTGYKFMFSVVEAVVLVLTVASFLISALTRSSKSYVLIGIGVFLAFAGRSILINSDTIITVLPGLIILSAGTWCICARLHLEYLWL